MVCQKSPAHRGVILIARCVAAAEPLVGKEHAGFGFRSGYS